MKKLKPKHLRFVNEYLVDLNGAQAAVRAGYSTSCAKVTAARLLKTPAIMQAIKQALNDQADRNKVDKDRIILGLLKEAQGEGSDTSASARVRAWELLGKHLGMFETRISRLSSQPTPNIIEVIADGAIDTIYCN